MDEKVDEKVIETLEGSANVDVKGEVGDASLKACEASIDSLRNSLAAFPNGVPFGVRADIKQQPLRPGTVLEGPLPKGSRPPGLFISSCLFFHKINFNKFNSLKCISC